MKSLLSVLLIITVLALGEGLAQGQQLAKIPRIGVLTSGSASSRRGKNFREILEGLRDLGYTEGKNIVFEYPGRSHDFMFLRRAVLGRLGVAAGYGDEFVDAAMAVFDTMRNDVEVFPEVRPTLPTLRQSYCVIAVTNGTIWGLV